MLMHVNTYMHDTTGFWSVCMCVCVCVCVCVDCFGVRGLGVIGSLSDFHKPWMLYIYMFARIHSCMYVYIYAYMITGTRSA